MTDASGQHWRVVEVKLLREIAHDLNGRLTGLHATIGVARLDQSAPEPLLAELEDAAERIGHQVEHLMHLTSIGKAELEHASAGEQGRQRTVLAFALPPTIELFRSALSHFNLEIDLLGIEQAPMLELPEPPLNKTVLIALYALANVAQASPSRAITVEATNLDGSVKLDFRVTGRPVSVDTRIIDAVAEILSAADPRAGAIQLQQGMRLTLPTGS